MDTKALLYGIIGFLLGGLIVSIAATTLNKTEDHDHGDTMSMSQMSDDLKGKKGDDFDKAFISGMIEHHQGAIDMARQAEKNAKHDEVKVMSQAIISAQEKEIEEMKLWQKQWGYESDHASDHNM